MRKKVQNILDKYIDKTYGNYQFTIDLLEDFYNYTLSEEDDDDNALIGYIMYILLNVIEIMKECEDRDILVELLEELDTLRI